MGITKPNQILKKNCALSELLQSSHPLPRLQLWDYLHGMTTQTAESKPPAGARDNVTAVNKPVVFGTSETRPDLLCHVRLHFCVLISYWGIKFFESLTASLICRSERYDAKLHGFQMFSHAVWTPCYITEKNMEFVKMKSQGNVLVDLNGRMKHLLFIQCV